MRSDNKMNYDFSSDLTLISKLLDKKCFVTSDKRIIDWAYYASRLEECRTAQAENIFEKEKTFVDGLKIKFKLDVLKAQKKYHCNFVITQKIMDLLEEYPVRKNNIKTDVILDDFLGYYIRYTKYRTQPDNSVFLLAWLWRDHRDVAIKFYEDLQLYDLVEKHKQRIARENQEPAPQHQSIIKEAVQHTRIPELLTTDDWLNPYNAKAIAFSGRHHELRNLDSFATHESCFKLWTIIGLSGSGKTRLSIEWQKRSEILKDWDKVFLDVRPNSRHMHPDYWNEWTPSRDTVLTIDGLFEFGDLIQRIIARCRLELPHKVRLLIIDRVFPENYHGLLKDNSWGFHDLSGQEFDFIKPFFFSEYPINLNKTEEQEKILTDIISQRSLSVSDDLITQGVTYLKASPDLCHPLFAALVGECLRTGYDFRTLSRKNLLYYYLSGKDRLPWKRGDTLGWLVSTFIAIAIIQRGTAYDDLYKFVSPEEAQSAGGYFEIKNMCNRFVSSDDNFILRPLTPNIIGEEFLLLFIEALCDNPPLRKKFIKILYLNVNSDSFTRKSYLIGILLHLSFVLSKCDQSDPYTYKSQNALVYFVLLALRDCIHSENKEFLEPKFDLWVAVCMMEGHFRKCSLSKPSRNFLELVKAHNSKADNSDIDLTRFKPTRIIHIDQIITLEHLEIYDVD